jgi:hypothetical protein
MKMTMSPREVATAWFDTVWNQGHEAAIDRYLGCTPISLLARDIPGRTQNP